jgi:hypothetical protein
LAVQLAVPRGTLKPGSRIRDPIPLDRLIILIYYIYMSDTYLLRDIDDELWRKVKSKAAAEGMTVKDVILKLLAEWVKSRK